jgi:ketosteroid isomerase-like protein
MPQGESENVRIVRQAFEAYRREDYEALLELADPELAMLGTVGGLTEGDVTRGTDEIRNALSDDDATWDSLEFELERIVDAGDRVVVFQKELRRGAASGIVVEAHTAVVFEFQDGRIVSIQGYMDQEEALRAVSAQEQ